MADLRREPLSSAIPIRLPLTLNNFLTEKAIEEGLKTQKGNPNPIPLIVDKLIECYNEGWEKNEEYKQPKIEVEINSNGELLEDITAKYVAICKVIEKYSHNGLEFYLKKADKELEKLKNKNKQDGQK